MDISEDSCGPSGCEIEWLTSDRVETDGDPAAFADFALKQGWSDGLPVVPPTMEAVRGYIKASGRRGELTIGELPPDGVPCTVENIAVNAVMAGAAPEAMPLLCEVVALLCEPKVYTRGTSTTTNAATQAIVVSGPVRHRLQVPFANGCLGGAATPAVAIGRAVRLIMRNVGGELVGVTSQSTFGQPGRIAGLLFGEWEEESPWTAFGMRRGVDGDAVTVFSVSGTMSISDTSARSGRTLATMIGRSLAYPCQATIISQHGGELMLLVNPAWAKVIAKDVGGIDSVRELVWESATVPRRAFEPDYDEALETRGFFDRHGDVRVLGHPEDLHIVVCGGGGGVHAMALPGYGVARAETRAIAESHVPDSIVAASQP
jgi:hypothetical protein